MKDIALVGACRTPIGSFGGQLRELSAPQLGAIVVGEALSRAAIPPAEVGDVILGCVLQAGAGMNVARQAALAAGLPESVPAETVNRVCGSGLQAVVHAVEAISVGYTDVIVAGGTESMSQAPYVLKGARWGLPLGHGEMVDTVLSEGLTCAINACHMGITAEEIAKRYGISREEQDAFALESQRRAVAAIAEGRFAAEIVPVDVPQRKGTVRVDRDEHPRPDTTLEALAALKPAFDPAGSVTAGNASGINDGAAALVVTTRKRTERAGVRPLGLVRAYATAGVDPRVMGMGPVPAVKLALARAGVAAADVALWELNEAFAVQALAVTRELGVEPARVNVNGGAVALGHPIGASGARILTTLLHALRARGGGVGVAALCIGGGMGIAMVVDAA
ncbi:MAG TPA: acetyl-CoA C-acetyltransferase [Vicinamibacterales bacterium]